MLAWQLVIFQGIRTSIAKKPYIFVIFQEGGWSGPPCPPPGFAHGHNSFCCSHARTHGWDVDTASRSRCWPLAPLDRRACLFRERLYAFLTLIICYILMSFIVGQYFNPYKPDVIFVGLRQTVQTQIRRSTTLRLIRISTVCLQNVLLECD